MTELHIAYGNDYLDWQLGEGHPTNPERALLATDLLIDKLGKDSVKIVAPKHTDADIKELHKVHHPAYIQEVLLGLSDEWEGAKPELGLTALKMFARVSKFVALGQGEQWEWQGDWTRKGSFIGMAVHAGGRLCCGCCL